MRKFRLFLTAIAAVLVGQASAQSWVPSEVSEGTFYLYNVGAQGFVVGANNWGTRASISKEGGIPFTLKVTDGKYELQSSPTYSGKHLGFNGYVDNPDANQNWTFEAVAGETNVYKMSTGEKYLFADQGATTTTVGDDPGTNYAYWVLVTRDHVLKYLSAATADNPLCATMLITNPNFGRNAGGSGWTIEASNKNLGGGVNENYCAESFHAVFTLTQTIEDMPNGLYSLTAQGFYRQDGTDNDNLPVFYANDKTGTFPLKTGSENNMSDASNSFTKGLYTIEPVIFEITDGTLTLGAKLVENTALWCIWDNFQLTYYGASATIDDVEKAAAIKVYKEALAKAKAVDTEATMDPTALQGITDALANYTEDKVLKDGATVESINAAATALNSAAEAATKSIANAVALMSMNDLMESTNVYTKSAYEAYKKIFDDYTAAWNAGTLTEAVVNPYALNGWHNNALDYDDLLLSAWSVGDNKCNNYDTSLYINTWSVEGDNDGTNFKVPFFEHWVADGNSLGANTLTATMTDLPEGQYSVSVWVRVRAKNGTDATAATGITLQANEGEAVDVTEGNQVGTSQFNIGEYVALGDVTDGTLKIQINVAADNNISWLSFKNAKFEKVGEATKIAGVTEKAAQKTIFNVAGQQMNGLQKGLNIVDGKKLYVK